MRKVKNITAVIVSSDKKFRNSYKAVLKRLYINVSTKKSPDNLKAFLKQHKRNHSLPFDLIILEEKDTESATEILKPFIKRLVLVPVRYAATPSLELITEAYEKIKMNVYFKADRCYGEKYSHNYFGNQLTQLRKYRGFSSQKDAAKYLGVSKQVYNLWELNKRHPNWEQMTTLLNSFDIDPNYFFISDARPEDFDLKDPVL